jgi:predicted DsbA family dithiol-disulfide isomerase
MSTETAIPQRKSILVEMIGDFSSGWCWVAKRRLEKVLSLSEVQEKYDVIVRHLPYLLNSSLPEAEELETMSAGTKPIVPQPFSQELYRIARRMGFKDIGNFRSNNLARSASTLQSHCLLKYCEMVQPYNFSENQLELAEAIYNSFLGNGTYPTLRNLSKMAEEHCGFDSKDVLLFLEQRSEEMLVRKEVYEYNKLGVKQLPFFVLNGKAVFAGCQEEEIMIKALEICPHRR